jgi:hypothetical protein
MYSIVNKRDSVTVSTMGNIKYYAIANGAMYAVDDAGHVLKETTPGVYDFSIVRSPGGNGAGLLGDQYGNLLYAQNSQLGKYDGSTWTDNFKSLTTGQHPMDTYEDLRVIGNGSNVAVLFSDDTFNSAALSLPSQMTVVAVKAGPTGILIGANFGYQGALILWDGNATRSKTPWKWTKGQILSIEKYGEVWIVKTQRGTFVTNGYTIKQLFGVFDDPLSFKSYDNANVLPQQMTVVNDTLIFAITGLANGPLSYEYGKMKPGIYLYSLSRKTWNYITVATGNTITLDINSVFADINYNNRILIGYRDRKAGNNYIATLTNTPPTRAQLVSEPLGIGRPHYQRVYFGPTEKIAEALILNIGILNSITDPATDTFNVTLKIYNFKRQLWGTQITTASISGNNKVQVDGTNTAFSKGVVGDEVTVLDGTNAGQIAHIGSIANAGLSNETWTLDTTLTGQTENNVHLNVQPWTLIEKKAFSNLSQLSNIYFNLSQPSPRGKQFLAKVVLDGIGANLALELQTSYFVFNDLGYDEST